MEFGNFKPNFVPRPVDQISNMLGKLDENNRRVSTAYHNVAQAFDSFNVAPVDKDYVDNMRNNIMSTMDEVIQSGDYAKMEGRLNKSIRQISSDPGLKARVLRYQDYNNKRNMVSDMYYKGTGDNKIDKLTYDIAMAQEYMPTQPDEHGVYDNEYKEFELPPKYFDVQTYLMNVAKQVEANSTTESPAIKYMTNKEYLTSMGADISGMSEAELNKPTTYLGYIKLGDKEYKTPQKIAEALTSMISANPDAQAYLNYISKHTEKPVASIIAENVNPIANMTSYVKDDSRYQMLGDGLSRARRSSTDQEPVPDPIPNTAPGIQSTQKEDIVSKISPSWLRDAANSVSSTVGEYLQSSVSPSIQEIGKTLKSSVDTVPKVSPDDPHYDIYDYVSNETFNKPYDKLTSEERADLIEPVLKFSEKAFPKILQNVITLTQNNPKVNEADFEVYTGISDKTFKTDKSGKLVQTIKNGNILDFETGEVLDNKEFREKVAKEIGKNSQAGVVYTGYTEYSGLGTIYRNHTNLNQIHTFVVGDKTYGFSSPVSLKNDTQRFIDDLGNHLETLRQNPNVPRTIKNGVFSVYVDYDQNNQTYKLNNIYPLFSDIEITGNDPIKIVNDYYLEVYSRIKDITKNNSEDN